MIESEVRPQVQRVLRADRNGKTTLLALADGRRDRIRKWCGVANVKPYMPPVGLRIICADRLSLHHNFAWTSANRVDKPWIHGKSKPRYIQYT